MKYICFVIFGAECFKEENWVFQFAKIVRTFVIHYFS